MANNIIIPSVYQKAIKDSIIKPKFRLSLLSQNETVKEEIVNDIIDGSGSLAINYQQGQRRSLNFSLINIDGKWTPNANNNHLWIDTRFKLDLGIQINDDEIYWQSNGIFVVANPQSTHQGANKQIAIQCYDKFAMLDGTLGGNIDGTYTIPVGTNIKQAVKDILMLDNGNNYPMDIKPLIFDSKYATATTAYTITKTPDSTLGDIIIELANMISCDVYYNESGNLVFQSGIDDIANIRKPVLWSYKESELEYLQGDTSYDFSKVKNRVIVVSSNVNNNSTYSAVAENNNAKSPTRIKKIGTRNKYIEDNNIYSNQLAQDRADYELNKVSILQLTISAKSTYMIHLDVNNCIEITDTHYGYKNDRFIIQSLNIPLSIGSIIDIQCTNIADLPFYTSTSAS